MTLEEIAATTAHANTLRVPAWVLGCVRRRSITFGNGIEDPLTRVFWVQAHGMTGDIRIHPARPHLSAGTSLAGLDRETLSLLASVEGGTATTSWADPVMSWSGWTAFQAYDKYPESGLMRRIGNCMVEFAPTSAYVEDWRFLPSKPGLVAGLRLETETDEVGRTYARNGGLVIAGNHAIRTIARRDELPDGTRCQDFVRASIDPAAALARVFDCLTDYMIRDRDNWIIDASTDPRRERTIAALIGPLTLGSDSSTLIETVIDTPGIARRQWRIDSLEANRSFTQSTDLGPAELAWLDREADTFFHPLHQSAPQNR